MTMFKRDARASAFWIFHLRNVRFRHMLQKDFRWFPKSTHHMMTNTETLCNYRKLPHSQFLWCTCTMPSHACSMPCARTGAQMSLGWLWTPHVLHGHTRPVVSVLSVLLQQPTVPRHAQSRGSRYNPPRISYRAQQASDIVGLLFYGMQYL